jgi:hypothetical protein
MGELDADFVTHEEALIVLGDALVGSLASSKFLDDA